MDLERYLRLRPPVKYDKKIFNTNPSLSDMAEKFKDAFDTTAIQTCSSVDIEKMPCTSDMVEELKSVRVEFEPIDNDFLEEFRFHTRVKPVIYRTVKAVKQVRRAKKKRLNKKLNKKHGKKYVDATIIFPMHLYSLPRA